MFNENKIFLIAFLTSAAVHGVIFVQNSNLALFSPQRKDQKTEISYLKNPQEPKAYLRPVPQIKDREEFLKLPAKIIANNRLPPQYPNQERNNIFKKDKESISSNPAFAKPAFTRPDIIAIKKKITLPPIDMNKINSPSYISYYQIVREKIRRAAYQNYSRIEVGEAYVSFIITTDGALKDVRLVGEKSSLSPYLREIALKSIREATPFPNFPKELDYPQLSFNVIISFEIE